MAHPKPTRARLTDAVGKRSVASLRTKKKINPRKNQVRNQSNQVSAGLSFVSTLDSTQPNQKPNKPPGGFGADDYWGYLGLGSADEITKSLTSLTINRSTHRPIAVVRVNCPPIRFLIAPKGRSTI